MQKLEQTREKIKSYKILIEWLDEPDSSVRAEIEQTQEWGGADVIITSSKAVIKENEKPNEWFPAAMAVFTPYAKTASWLLYKLQKDFYFYLYYTDKHEFYGRFAQAIESQGPKANEKIILTAMLDEADKIVDELLR